MARVSLYVNYEMKLDYCVIQKLIKAAIFVTVKTQTLNNKNYENNH